MKNLKEFIEILKSVTLFRNIEIAELDSVLGCIGASVRMYRKGTIIISAGSRPDFIGIVLSGQVHISRQDYNGNRSLIAAFQPGDIFAEALCCAGVQESPVTVTAAVNAAVMQIRFSHLLKPCSNRNGTGQAILKPCVFHAGLIENMLKIIADKNIMLQRRMEFLSIKSVRAKIWEYLSSAAPKRKEPFAIPFNREEMAEYLSVERSALSHELSRMKKDGLIEYKKNCFIIQ